MDYLLEDNYWVLTKYKENYYEDIYVSLFTNLNNRVYDENNMLIGMNKNWIDDPENAKNEFVPFIDNNEGDE